MQKLIIVFIFLLLLFSCQSTENNVLKVENQKLKAVQQSLHQEIETLKEENRKLSSQVYNEVTEMRKLKSQKKKELARSLMHIKWEEVIGKMKSWTLKELQERVLDLKQNTQGVERANKTWIEKQFSDLSNQERLTPEERNRRAVENEYMKLLFIYQLKRAENILLMPAQLE